MLNWHTRVFLPGIKNLKKTKTFFLGHIECIGFWEKLTWFPQFFVNCLNKKGGFWPNFLKKMKKTKFFGNRKWFPFWGKNSFSWFRNFEIDNIGNKRGVFAPNSKSSKKPMFFGYIDLIGCVSGKKIICGFAEKIFVNWCLLEKNEGAIFLT